MGYSMRKNKTYHRKKTVLLWVLCMGMMVGLAGRLVYLCVFRSVYYSEKADDLHERERGIKAAHNFSPDLTKNLFPAFVARYLIC